MWKTEEAVEEHLTIFRLSKEQESNFAQAKSNTEQLSDFITELPKKKRRKMNDVKRKRNTFFSEY